MPRDRRVLGPRKPAGARSESPPKNNTSTLGVARGKAVDPNTGRIIEDHSAKSTSSSKSSSKREKSKDKKSTGKKDQKKHERAENRSTSKDRESDGGKARSVASMSMEETLYSQLPRLKDIDAKERLTTMSQKISACILVYDFRHQDVCVTEKEGKRQTLVELLDFVSNSTDGFCWTETLLHETLEMVGANIFRPLVKRERTPMDILDPEDEEPVLEPMWPHLELVYDFALRAVASKDLDSSVIAKQVDAKFISRLVELFDSDDPRERDSLKLLMNKIYGRVSSLRSAIRRAIQTACLRAVCETNEAQNGFSELLEILARIIGNFSTPLKEESRACLVSVLLPLLKVEWLGMFHPQLADCIKKFLDKDPKLTYDVMSALLRYWPFSLASKQSIFISEVETCLHMMPLAEFKRVQDGLSHRLALCLSSPHSDVAERSLGLWKSDRFVKLLTQNCREQFPSIISALYDNFTQHWHSNVHNRTLEVLKMLMETDPELFDTSSTKHRKIVEAKEKQQTERERKWGVLQALHDRRRSNAINLAPRTRRKQSPSPTNATGSKAADFNLEEPAPTPKVSVKDENATFTEIPLKRERYGVAMTWEAGNMDIEIGLQALAVDSKGRIIDAVHELCPTIMQSVILRPEDRPVNARSDCSGMLWFALSRLPEQVALLVFVVCSLGDCSLRDTVGRGVHVVEETAVNELAHFVLERPAGDSGVVAVVRRTAEKGWGLLRLEEFAKTGRHFMDILEPTLGKVVREAIPALPKRQRAALSFTSTTQGGVSCLPTAVTAKWLFIGLSWDLTPSETQNVGLTLSAVFFDAQTRHLGAVTPDSTEAFGAKHSGVGILSQGILVDLHAMPIDVVQIFICGHLATQQSTFELIQKPCVCVLDPQGAEMMRYSPAPVVKEGPCLVVGRIFRTDGCWSSASIESSQEASHWAFQVIGSQCGGVSWQDSIFDLRNLCEKPLAAFQRLPVDVHTGGNCTVSL